MVRAPRRVYRKPKGTLGRNVGKTPPTYASFCCVFVHRLDDTFEVLYLLLMSTIPDSIVCSPLQFQT
jgi:hypothetical protein